MAYFRDTEDLKGTLGRFFELMAEDPRIGTAFSATQSLVKVSFTEPDLTVWIDCRQAPPVVSAVHDEAPDVELTMLADNGHRFWLGRLSFPVALTSRRIKVHGPTSKLMKLLPVMKPIHRRYEHFLEDQGRHDLVAI